MTLNVSFTLQGQKSSQNPIFQHCIQRKTYSEHNPVDENETRIYLHSDQIMQPRPATIILPPSPQTRGRIDQVAMYLGPFLFYNTDDCKTGVMVGSFGIHADDEAF